MAGVPIPLRAVEHVYVVSEPAENLPSPFPIVRDLDTGIYIKGDAGKLVLGTFEDNPKLWDPESVTPDVSYLTFDADWDHAEPMLKAGIHRLPQFESLGISQFMNGPESFTPDTRQIMGRAPSLENFYVAAGFNSIGIMSSAGVGKAMAEWVVNGAPAMDLWEVDIARFAPEDNDGDFLNLRIPESVHNQFQIHWPFKQYRTGRIASVRSGTISWRVPAPYSAPPPAGNDRYGSLKARRPTRWDTAMAISAGGHLLSGKRRR